MYFYNGRASKMVIMEGGRVFWVRLKRFKINSSGQGLGKVFVVRRIID